MPAMLQNRDMDVPKLLEAACLLVPEEIATEGDITVKDVWEHLTRDEWEVALGLLEELGDRRPLPPGFWETLAGAAEQLRLERSPAWCHWRGYETRHGILAERRRVPSCSGVVPAVCLIPSGQPAQEGGDLCQSARRTLWDQGHDPSSSVGH